MVQLPDPAMPILYVHGAGPQYESGHLKRVLDSILIGKLGAIDTHMAYFASVLYDPIPTPPQFKGVAAAMSATGVITLHGRPRLARGSRLRVATLAEAMAAVAPDQDQPTYLFGTTKTLAKHLVKAVGVPAADRRAAEALAAQLIRQTPTAIHVESVNVPNTAFKIILEAKAKDVLKYFWDEDVRDRMRALVRTEIKQRTSPFVMLAHSLGSIVAFDILAELGTAVPDVHLVTAGCPLGIEDVQIRLVHGSKRPVKTPPSIRTWQNFASTRDVVALSKVLNGDFAGITIHDHTVNLAGVALIEHDLTGYVALPGVKEAALLPAV